MLIGLWCIYCFGLGWFIGNWIKGTKYKWWAVLLWPIFWPIGLLNNLENKL